MPTDDAVDWTTVYRALADDDRRTILQYLDGVGSVTLDDVARQLLEGDPELFDGDPVAVQAGLYHVHLPVLSAAGLVDWTPERGEVTLSRMGARLPPTALAPQLRPPHDSRETERAVD